MITVENLSKSFPGSTGPVVALDDVSLDIGIGSLYGIVGPTGAGKSTLARLIALQDRPDSGVIRLEGHSLAAMDTRKLRAARRRIGVVDRTSGLVPNRTAAGNIALPLEQAGVDAPVRKAKVGRLLDLTGLTELAGVQPGGLTEGQRRRVEVARALVGEPSVLLADDPTAGLDPEGHAGVLAALDRARAELGVTVLVATDDLNVVRRVCDEVALLDRGRVLDQGGLLDLVHSYDSPIAQAVLPVLDTAPSAGALYDRVADVVLVGFAAVGALLPEAANRFGTDFAVLSGGLIRLGDTPVARFRLGVSGARADTALRWIGERGGLVRQPLSGPQGVAA